MIITTMEAIPSVSTASRREMRESAKVSPSGNILTIRVVTPVRTRQEIAMIRIAFKTLKNSITQQLRMNRTYLLVLLASC